MIILVSWVVMFVLALVSMGFSLAAWFGYGEDRWINWLDRALIAIYVLFTIGLVEYAVRFGL